MEILKRYTLYRENSYKIGVIELLPKFTIGFKGGLVFELSWLYFSVGALRN